MKDEALKLERKKIKESKELKRREKQFLFKENKFYLFYLFMILSLVFITDEIASTISIQFQSNIVNEFFVNNLGLTYGEGLSIFSALGFIKYVKQKKHTLNA